MRLMKSVLLFLTLLVGTSICSATTWVVGPNSTTPAPALPYSTYYGGNGQPTTMDICAAIEAAVPGDTIQVDYNNGIPYTMTPWHNGGAGGTIDCWMNTNNLTIIGFNGRPIIDLTGRAIYKAPFDITAGNGGATGGQNITFINFEIRGAASSHQSSTAAFRIESGTTAAPAGGNTTIEYCYIHDNGGDGVLANSVGTFDGNAFGVANPFITLLNDELSNNGYGDYGYQHNMYIGADSSGQEVFNMYYTWTHDAVAGHTVKTRAPNNNIYYNMIGDAAGQTNTLIDMPFGGSTYIVGNSFYRVTTNQNQNRGNVILYDYDGATPGGYGSPAQNNPPYNYQDLHVVNNTFVIDPGYGTNAYITLAAGTPIPLTTNAVIENNIFIGPASLPITNQTTAVLGTAAIPNSNLVLTNNSTGGDPVIPGSLDVLTNGSAVTSLFVNAKFYDFHLLPGATSVIGQGIATPTLNDGSTADTKAKAVSEFLQPDNTVTRPNVKDLGAYSYPRSDTPPTLNLTCTSAVTTPGSGTFTVTGLPTPISGQYNAATFESENLSVISNASATSVTGTVSGMFTVIAPTNGAAGTFAVPVDVYVAGEHLTCSVAVTPGPSTLLSITNDNGNGSGFSTTSVNLLNPPTTASGPLTVSLSSTDQSILYVPSSVTVPVGTYSAETGSTTGSLWGQSPASKTATITGIANGVTKTLSVVVNAPIISGYCNMYPCTVVGGQQANILVDSYFDFPTSGATVVFSTDNAAIPNNQSITIPQSTFYTNVTLATNPVTTTTSVNLSGSANGSGANYGPVSVIPGVGVPVTITVASGSGQSAAVNTNFAQPLVALVKDSNGTVVSGVTVFFGGTGVSFPNNTNSAVTGSNGLASVVATPTQASPLTISANYYTSSGNIGSTPAVFTETGTTTTPTSIVATSGSGQTAPLNLNFAYPLVVTVTGAGGVPVLGGVVTFTGSGVSFPTGKVVVTNSSGVAQVTVAPTSSGSLTVTASVSGLGSTANFSETGTTGQPSTLAKISGDNQSAILGQSFASPLVVQVNTSGGVGVPGVAVNFSGAGVSYTSNTFAVTNSSGQAQISAVPDNPGALTITATVASLQPVIFTETGTQSGVYLVSVTPGGCCADDTIINLSGVAPAGGAVVSVTSSNLSVLWAPASVTVPAGSSSQSIGSLLGSAWGQTPTSQNATLTAKYNGVQQSLSEQIYPLQIHAWGCNVCTVTGGSQASINISTAFGTTPYGGLVIPITSDNQAVIPNQSPTIGANQNEFNVYFNTNAGQPTTTVNVTINMNGILGTFPVIVNSGAAPTSISVSSGSGQSAALNTNFVNPLVVLVQGAGNVPMANVTVTYAGTGIGFPNGNTAVTNSSGLASVVADPTTAGSLTVTASVSGLGSTANFSETGTSSSGGTLASITLDNTYDDKTSVNLVAAATAPVVVTLSSSDSTVLWVPASVTIPTGASTAETGSLLGSLWGQSPSSKTATITASYNGVQKTLTNAWGTLQIHAWSCNLSPCTVTGGNPAQFLIMSAFATAPVGGALIPITSDFPAIIPNQSVTQPAGNGYFYYNVNTNAGQSTQIVTVTVTYNGIVGTFPVTVNGTAVNTTTGLASSLNPSTYKASVKFTATVTPSAATGTVTFKDGSTTLGTGTVSGGVATYTTTSLAVGTHSITAVYGGATGYTGSTSSALSQVVNKANTTTALVSSLNPSISGASVKFTATMNPTTATGTVTFKDGSTTLGTGTLSSGVATYTTTTLSVGTHSITAVYGGSSSYNGSTSSALSQVVSGVTITSVTADGYQNASVNLSAAAPAGGIVVTLSSSNTAVEWVPASVTVPAGATTALMGNELGSTWGQSPQTQNATLTATYGGVQKTLNQAWQTSQIHSFWCNITNCAMQEGTPVNFQLNTAWGNIPVNASISVSSSNTAVIANQSIPLATGTNEESFNVPSINAGLSQSTTVNLTFTYNGQVTGPYAVTVTP